MLFLRIAIGLLAFVVIWSLGTPVIFLADVFLRLDRKLAKYLDRHLSKIKMPFFRRM